jgi:hypothetical protein
MIQNPSLQRELQKLGDIIAYSQSAIDVYQISKPQRVENTFRVSFYQTWKCPLLILQSSYSENSKFLSAFSEFSGLLWNAWL